MTWTQTLRERWWLAPVAILVVAAAIVIRIITTPLEVNANVNDGDQAVPRTATIDLHFNQDMKADSVQHAFSLSPSVLVAFKAVSPREFQFRPHMAPNTAYHVSIKDAKNTSGRGVTSGFSFKTEPAPGRIGSGAPTIIQIENSIDARPQAGMQQADMVYEYISEGSIPRLSVIYWDPLPDLVGPVRSCRPITIRLGIMFKGMIYCSGANDYILGLTWQHPNLVNDYSHGAGNVFYRDNNTRYAPHNVMMHGNNATTFTAQQNLPALVYDIAPKHPDATFTGDAAPTVNVPDHGAVWHYDAASKQYFKTQDGAAFNNVGTGRVHAKTVIVQYVNSYLDTNPANSFHGYFTEAYELTGDGKADIFVDGVVVHATWHHPDPNVPAVYLDAAGNPIDLDNGLTWVHVIGSEKWHMIG